MAGMATPPPAPGGARAPEAPAPEDDGVAAPPRMPVQSTLYIAKDGTVQFGALFRELVPVAKALDPSLDLPDVDEPAGG